MTIVSILALLVMMFTAGGLVHEFFQLNKDNEKTQAKFDQMLAKGVELLTKFDQLTATLATINTTVTEGLSKKPRKRQKRREPAAGPADGATAPDPTAIEPKGGSDEDKKTSPAT